jgi:hypothetical protein
LRSWRPEHLGDGSQHSLTVGEDLIVPEAKNPPALPPQLAVALIMIAQARMLATVGFDNQARFQASEIDDVGRYRELASKSPAELMLAEFFP